MKFKQGDIVVITTSKTNFNSYMRTHVERLVKIFNIEHYRNRQYITFIGDEDWNWVYEDNHFRKASDLESFSYHILKKRHIKEL